jgi:hypothetical protein
MGRQEWDQNQSELNDKITISSTRICDIGDANAQVENVSYLGKTFHLVCIVTNQITRKTDHYI